MYTQNFTHKSLQERNKYDSSNLQASFAGTHHYGYMYSFSMLSVLGFKNQQVFVTNPIQQRK